MGIDPEAENRLAITLQPFRDHVFYFEVFDEGRFGDDHYHCIACWKTIAGREHRNADHEGYVTLHEVRYTGFPVSISYTWACKECFPQYCDANGWTVSVERTPEISDETKRAFSEAYKDYLGGKQEQ